MFNTQVVLINVGNCCGDARPALESIQDMEFGGYDHLTRYLKEQHQIDPASVEMYSMNDYMDDFNDSDSDRNLLKLNECFMGYVRTPKKLGLTLDVAPIIFTT